MCVPCIGCGLRYFEKPDNWVQCELCDGWMMMECDDHIKTMNLEKNVYFCPGCRENICVVCGVDYRKYGDKYEWIMCQKCRRWTMDVCDFDVIDSMTNAAKNKRYKCIYCRTKTRIVSKHTIVEKGGSSFQKKDYTTVYTPSYFGNIDDFELNYPDEILRNSDIPPIFDTPATRLATEKFFDKYYIVFTGLKSVARKPEKNLVTALKHLLTTMTSKKKKSEISTERNRVVVTCSPIRTAKFTIAIACNSVVVHYNWIINCFLKGREVDMRPYILPTGKIKGEKIYHELTPYVPENLTLYNHNIIIIGFAKFITQWTKVVETAGAVVLKDLWQQNIPTILKNQVHFIIADSEQRPSDFLKAEKLGIPVLSTEWVIHCLVKREIIDYTEDLIYTDTT
eukprot:TRINITY_DN3930_c0_g3_i1.p1 TRINITY_DN3930_c0_g3~~TRINITY_DN3930_c0_g3_i1.p1  ORF type:complete len:410 (-),score=74.32 TRINITY_DN3930_c0_g3_i1:302-1486(-)